jgi:transcriptional regulator CtsR
MARLTLDIIYQIEIDSAVLVASRELEGVCSKLIDAAAYDGCGVVTTLTPQKLSLILLKNWECYVPSVASVALQNPDVFGLDDAAKKTFLGDVLDSIETNLKNLSDEAEDYLDKIVSFCRYFSIEVSETQLESVRNSLYLSSFISNLHSNFKYIVNVKFLEADGHQTESPEVPEIVINGIFPRSLNLKLKRNAIQTRLSNGKDRADSFVYSLFQGLKKGLPPIRPHHVSDALIKHRKSLTATPAPLNDQFRYFANMLLKCEFKDCVVPKQAWTNRPRLGSLSNKGTVEVSRAAGGQVGLGLAYTVPGKARFDRNWIKKWSPLVEEFQGFVEVSTKLYSFGSLLSTQRHYREHYALGTEDDIIDFLEKGKLSGEIKSGVVQPAVVLEPLKGRIITKPNAGDYIRLTNAQKFLWERLKKRREFELIGRSVSVEDVFYIARDYVPGDFFVSGDYSAATDNLSSEMSKLIIQYLFQEWDPSQIDYIIKTFCHAKVDYSMDPIREEDSPWLTRHWGGFQSCSSELVGQMNGQLMGHVLSFPVLCLANFIAFRYSYWLENQTPPPVLINGDDILFKCQSKEDYTRWKSVVSMVGFNLSLGKNLTSVNVCQINSVYFRIIYDFDMYQFKSYIRNIRAVPYLNFGVVTGRGKGKEDMGSREGIVFAQATSIRMSTELPSMWDNLDCLTRWGGYWDFNLVRSDYFRYRKALYEGNPVLKGLNPLSIPREVYVSSFSSDAHPTTVLKGNHLEVYPAFGCTSEGNYLKTRVGAENNFKKELRLFRSDPFYVLRRSYEFEFEQEEATVMQNRL